MRVVNTFKRVIIIYNPNSTGDSQKNARALEQALANRRAALKVEVIATEYAGHALEIARKNGGDAAAVIVSSSGDGGYNEVVNGVLEAGGHAATAVLPAGNANDHHASAGSGQLVDNILTGKDRLIETIGVTATINGKAWSRRAHSYVGFGLTPKVGKVLTEQRPNVVTEKWHVLWHALSFRHVTLIVEGERRRYSNLIFSTVSRMSKVIKLDSEASLHDGKMELYATKFLSPFGILRLLISASMVGITSRAKVSRFELTTQRETLVQLDGEVFTLDAGSRVQLVCHRDSLRTVI